jgi:nicotinate-nucleotide pyrophosphorylase (carboxylating)
MLEAIAKQLVKFALSEDVGDGDITTLNVLRAGVRARGSIIAKQSATVAGLEVARLTFLELEPAFKFEPLVQDGEAVESGVAVARLTGPAGALLTGERTALNFLQRMSGVATLTRRYVDAVKGTGVTILDTRKTTPGLRYLEKYAVTRGGGQNHRYGLWDMYLVKDNHIRTAGGVTAAIEMIQRTRQDALLEVEVESMEQLREALRPEVDRILVDNQPVEDVRRAVEEVDRYARAHAESAPRRRSGARRWPEVEVSGGIHLENVRLYAETGADYVSVGALTHSAPAVDFNLEIEEVG